MRSLKYLDNDDPLHPHTYWLDNQRLPSVSQVIGLLSTAYDGVDQTTLEAAAHRGNAVDSMVRLYLENDLDETTLDPALLKPLDAFKKWQDKFQFEGKCGTPTYWEVHGMKYGGTPDLVGTIKVVGREPAIIDIKATYRVWERGHALQLAGYAGGDMLPMRIVLNLNNFYKTGLPKTHTFDDPDDHLTFAAALRCWYWMNR